MDLAPIIIFTYNRPIHTKNLLDSLAKNNESKDSVLYIFCDGKKNDVNEEGFLKIKQVREICRNEIRFKEVIIKVQEKNKGLANSIIDGVTEIINKHDVVIVLEDDLIVSPYFLSYMNDSLGRYKNNPKVGQIGACNFFACGERYPSFFFIPTPDCLGWATWKDRWSYFNFNVNELLEELENSLSAKLRFNAYGSFDFINMLDEQKKGKISSWAIRWQAVNALKEWSTLYPNPSMTNHIESNEATHANVNITPPIQLNKPFFKEISLEENHKVIEAYKLGYSGNGDYYGNKKKLDEKKNHNNIKLIQEKNTARKVISKLYTLSIKNIVNHFSNKKVTPIRKISGWFGGYQSWQEVQNECSGYNKNTILEKCKNALLKVKHGEAVYERDSFLFDEIQYSWPLLAGLQKVALENNGNLNVLDFGGSLGSTYYQNKDFLNLKSLQWNIVEQENFVQCGKEFFENNELNFYFNIEECIQKNNPNVLLLSSVLQYLEKPIEWIEKFNQLNIEYIILDRTGFVNSQEDIITKQIVPKEIYDASYPCWFFNEGKLNSLFKNYTTICQFDGTAETKETIDDLRVYWKGKILKKI
jgi:putative methyltransferase (TIGR04325 family)